MSGERFKAWSFSRWQDYTRCPAFARYKHLLKLRAPAGPAADRGTLIHNDAEAYILGKTKRMPEELTGLRREYTALRALGVKGKLVTEQMWGFDREWRPCDPKAWDVCWLRVKADVVYLLKPTVLAVDDHKSGRRKDDEHGQQLSLYGLSALLRYPKVQEVRGRMLYVDKHDKLPLTFHRRDVEGLKTKWEHNVAFMFADKRFAPRPSNACTWCQFSKAKGGPCKF